MTLRGLPVAIGPKKHVTSRGPDRNQTKKTRHFEGPGSQSNREDTTLRGVRARPKQQTRPRPWADLRIFTPHTFESDLRFSSFRRKYDPDPFPDPPGTSLRGVRVAVRPRKHDPSRGPGRSRTEKTRHFEGSKSLLDRGHTSLRGVRVAIGPRKHATSRNPGRDRIEKTRHFEGSGTQLD